MGSASFDHTFRAGRLVRVVEIGAAVAGSADGAPLGGRAAGGWPRSDGRLSKDAPSTAGRSRRALAAASGSTLKGDRDRRTVGGASFLGVAAIVGVTASTGRAKTGREGRFGDTLGRRQISEERDANSASDGAAASSRRPAGRKPGAIGEALGGGPSANIESGATVMGGSADNLSAGAEDITMASGARDMRSATKASQWAGASG